MPVAGDIQGKVFRNGTGVFMARVEDSAAQTINRASVASMKVTVYELTRGEPDVLTAVTGHDGVALDKNVVVFDTLQNDNAWTVDTVGYNFRHELDVSANEAFPKAGADYQVRYEMTPVLGQKIVFRFHMRCI